MITIVLPVYNEEPILKENTLRLFKFCKDKMEDCWQIIIADNASDDETQEIGENLAGEYQEIKYFRTNQRGKGGAVLRAWKKFPSDIYVYMDVDLSTNLCALPELIQGIRNSNDIVAGSRMVAGAQVERPLTRKIFSYGLRFILKIFCRLKTQDAPCGFKAVNTKIIDKIVPQIQNKQWCFDTEMLILAERQGFSIKEIPVQWTEASNKKRKSGVGIVPVMWEYLKNIYRMKIKAK